MTRISQKIPENKKELTSLSLALYGSFYPAFYLLEITLKTRLFNLVQEKLGENWFSKQLEVSEKDSLFRQELEQIKRRKPKGFKVKAEGLLVESGLGFWVEFFNKRVYKLTKGIPILIFTNLPAEVKRKEIYAKLDNVKEIRNQLVHFRIPPITQSADLKYLDQLQKAVGDLTALLAWLNVTETGTPIANEVRLKSAEIINFFT